MNPANAHVIFGERCHRGPQAVSPAAVVKYLVQNEPLTHVAEILRCVDGYASELKQGSFTVELLDAAIDRERGINSSIDELLRECQGIYTTIGKRMKEAENVIDTRSQDLQGVIAQLRSTPLTTPANPSPGVTGPSVAQMSTKVEEIGVAQTGILNALQASRDKLKVALDELSNRRKSLVLLGASTRQVNRPPPSPCAEHAIPAACARTSSTLQLYDSLWERYQRGSQEFQSGIDRIVKNGETIRDLALVLERGPDSDPTIAPLAGRPPTLAEELLACQTPNTDTAAVSPLTPRNESLLRRLQAACVELLKVWGECLLENFLLSSPVPIRPSLLVSTFFVFLFVLVDFMRTRYCVGGPDPMRGAFWTVTSSSIRDLLLGDRANMPDELICNLVPKR